MIQWRFKLDDVFIEEPQGFAALALTLDRHPTEHGISVEASVESLGFYGEAYEILLNAKNEEGVDAVRIFTAEQKCEGEADWSEAICGKLNFASYRESCGDICIIRMSIENKNCYMTFKNRMDQKVDLQSVLAFDKVTQLVPYSGLGINLSLATQEIPISADAEVSEDGDGTYIPDIDFSSGQALLIRPIYAIVTDNSILTGQLSDPANFFEDPARTFFISPQILVEEANSCIDSEYPYEVRLKGSVMLEDIAAIDEVIISLEVNKWIGDLAVPKEV